MTHTHFRFGGLIDIEKLEHETRKLLFLGFALALLLHAIAGAFLFSAIRQEAVKVRRAKRKPVPVKLIAREAPSRYLYRRGRVHDPVPRHLSSMRRFGPASPTRAFKDGKVPMVGNRETIGPLGELDMFYSTPPVGQQEYHVFDNLRLQNDGVERYDGNELRITDEMISVEELDTGQYKGLIITNPNDEHLVRGYIHIPSGIVIGGEKPEISQMALDNLSKFAMKQFTDIEIILDPIIEIGSHEIFKYPFLYISSSTPFELKPHEARNFREYLEQGGFALVEPTGIPDAVSPADMSIATSSMRNMIAATFGHPSHLVQLSKDHILFHCFFDIDIEHGYNKFPIKDYGAWWKQPLYCLEGVFVGERLALVYSEKGYGYGWDENGPKPAYSFGVNCIVYALRHFGGTARKIVDVSTGTPSAKPLSYESWPIVHPNNESRGPFGAGRHTR